MEYIWLKLLLVFTLLSNFANAAEEKIVTSLKKNSDDCNNNTCEHESMDLKIHRDFECNEECKNSRCCNKPPQAANDTDSTICTKTFENNYVNMISKCPTDYKGIEKTYCEYQKEDLRHDLWLMTPVTHSESNQTYRNVFCAYCHNLGWRNVTFWELRPYCVRYDTGRPIEAKIKIDLLRPTNKGFWRLTQHHKHLFCFLHPIATDSLNLSRCAAPTPFGSTTNVTCAKGNQSSEATSRLPPFRLFDDKNPSPKFSKCDDLPSHLMELLCLKLEGGGNKCMLDIIQCTEDSYKNDYSNHSSDLLDFETFKINSTTLYTCRPADSKLKENWLKEIMHYSAIPMRSLMVAIFIYLLIFAWLPKKSTFDMSLAILAVCLLLQGVCVAHSYHEHGPKLVHCAVLASIWHYTLLCTCSWMLILSYDYWLNLYQVFSIYQLVDEYDRLHFLIYFVLCQLLPAMVTGAALYFRTGAADVYCNHPHGHKKSECLLDEVPDFDGYFIVSTVILFVANTYYLLRVAWIAHHEKLSGRDRQRLRYRFLLTKGSPLWMLSSLLLLAHFKLPVSDGFITGVHLLQGLFFLYVAFAQMMTRLLKMVDEIQQFTRREIPNHQITSSQEAEMPEPTAAPGRYRSIECAYGDVYL